MVLAEQIKFNSKFENSEIELRSDMGFPGAENIQAGTSMSMKHGGGSSFNSIKTGGSIVYSQGSNTAGFDIKYDHSKGSANTRLALQNK